MRSNLGRMDSPCQCTVVC